MYKIATSILLKFLTLKWNISRTIWHFEVSDGLFFCIFHALSFELNFFRPEFPFKKACILTFKGLRGHFDVLGFFLDISKTDEDFSMKF